MLRAIKTKEASKRLTSKEAASESVAPLVHACRGSLLVKPRRLRAIGLLLFRHRRLLLSLCRRRRRRGRALDARLSGLLHKGWS